MTRFGKVLSVALLAVVAGLLWAAAGWGEARAAAVSSSGDLHLATARYDDEDEALVVLDARAMTLRAWVYDEQAKRLHACLARDLSRDFEMKGGRFQMLAVHATKSVDLLCVTESTTNRMNGYWVDAKNRRIVIAVQREAMQAAAKPTAE